jgi:hypothetical protein
MAHNRNISQLDTAQSFKRSFDCEHDAIRVVQAVNTEMAIEIRAEEGDSVLSVAKTQCIKEEDGEVDCQSLRRICKYGEGGSVHVSPDGSSWVELPVANLEVKQLCAMKVKVTGCMIVGQS